MSQKKEKGRGGQNRRLLLNIAVAILGLALLTGLLFVAQSRATISRQQSNSQTKLDIAAQRLTEYAEGVADKEDLFDSFSQAKVDAIACFLRLCPDTDTSLKQLKAQWQLDSLTIVTDESAESERELLAEVQGSESTLELENGERYYCSELAGGKYLLAGRSTEALLAETEDLRSITYALDSIKVGSTGYILAIDEAGGSVLYHPQTELMGQSAADLSIDPAKLAAGYEGYIRIQGQRFYCESRTSNGVVLAALIPEAELSSYTRTMVWPIVIAFAIGLGLMLVYVALVHRDHTQNAQLNPCEYSSCGKKSYLNRTLLQKLTGALAISLVLMVVVTFYTQSLLAVSYQTKLLDNKLSAVQELLDRADVDAADETKLFTNEYTRRTQNVAWLIGQEPSLANDESLTQLAAAVQIHSIYVFDDTGYAAATTDSYKGFTLSEDPESQSYPFWTVVQGHQSTLVQDPMINDQGEYQQFIGVQRLDAPGMVQIGLLSTRLENKLATVSFNYVLSNIAVENNGFLIALNPDNTIAYHSNEKMIGRDASVLGLTAPTLEDGYLGFQNVNGQSCLVSGQTHGEHTLLTAVPTSTLYRSRIAMTLCVFAVSLVVFIIMIALMVISREKPDNGDIVEPGSGKRLLSPAARPVQSAASRWSDSHIPWKYRTPSQKLQKIISWLIGIAAILLIVYTSSSNGAYEQGSLISYIMNQRWEKVPSLFSLTYIVLILVETVVIAALLCRLLVALTQRFGSRIETVGRLLANFVKYMAVIACIFYCLSFVGVDSGTLLASAGIASVIIGLGAQKLISDILAGIFIVFEGEFRVGDIVTVGDWRGTVMEIGVRTTKIQSPGGDIKILSNSSISGVVNMTKQFSYSVCDVGIGYGESLEHLESVLMEELPKVKKNLPAIENGPFYKGVVSLDDSSVVFRVVAQCKESDRPQLNRDLNRAMKLILDRNNIEIPFPQVVINQPTEKIKATRAEERKAEQFVNEQKELSKDIAVKTDEEN